MDGRTLHRIRNMCVWQPGRAGLDRSEQRRTEKDRAKKKAAFPLERASGQATTREGEISKTSDFAGERSSERLGKCRKEKTRNRRSERSRFKKKYRRNTHNTLGCYQPASLPAAKYTKKTPHKPTCLPACLPTCLPTLLACLLYPADALICSIREKTMTKCRVPAPDDSLPGC